jgi:hypothetical protein
MPSAESGQPIAEHRNISDDSEISTVLGLANPKVQIFRRFEVTAVKKSIAKSGKERPGESCMTPGRKYM